MHPIYAIYALETFPYGILHFTNKSNKNLEVAVSVLRQFLCPQKWYGMIQEM
jgi:hypothetical protein